MVNTERATRSRLPARPSVVKARTMRHRRRRPHRRWALSSLPSRWPLQLQLPLRGEWPAPRPFEGLLAWLPRQRTFGGRSRAMQREAVIQHTPVALTMPPRTRRRRRLDQPSPPPSSITPPTLQTLARWSHHTAGGRAVPSGSRATVWGTIKWGILAPGQTEAGLAVIGRPVHAAGIWSLQEGVTSDGGEFL
jgi:hypothetical protein